MIIVIPIVMFNLILKKRHPVSEVSVNFSKLK